MFHISLIVISTNHLTLEFITRFCCSHSWLLQRSWTSHSSHPKSLVSQAEQPHYGQPVTEMDTEQCVDTSELLNDLSIPSMSDTALNRVETGLGIANRFSPLG